MPSYGLTAQTARQQEGGKKKPMGKGCNVTRGGTKQLSVFCHMKPLRNICDRNCRPERHGGPSLCFRQIFFLPIWGWCKQEIVLLIISVHGLRKEEICTAENNDVKYLEVLIDCSICSKKRTDPTYSGGGVRRGHTELSWFGNECLVSVRDLLTEFMV